MEGQLVALDVLPSKGEIYPKDIEIYVKPLSIKQQMDNTCSFCIRTCSN